MTTPEEMVEAINRVIARGSALETELQAAAAFIEGHRWIPVEERLPTHIYSVLVLVINSPNYIGPEYVDIGIYNPRRAKWQINDGDDDIDVEVSKWREINKPPEPEK